MCGIAGVIRLHDPRVGPAPAPLDAIPESWLDALDDAISHRGPDGEGRFRDRSRREDGSVVDVALVHRRLSIIDIQGGAQPMVHDGARLRPDLVYHRGGAPIIASEIEPDKPLVAVVFNGCIYNHRELRAELEAKGHAFGTDHSDTEVLVHGWRAWRVGIADRLESMHAFGVWDPTNRVEIWDGETVPNPLTLLNDTPGEKRVRTMQLPDPRSTVFASSAGAIERLRVRTGDGRERRALDFDFLRLGTGRVFDRGPHDEGFVHARVGSLSRSAYPDPDRAEPLTPDRVEALLRESVRDRLESDVPLACFLSGGVDSSLLSALARESLGSVTTVSVKMPDPRYDESAHARRVAAHLGTDHREVEVSADPAHDLVALIEEMGQPFGDSSLLPTMWAARAAREHAKVALSGDGGDELFMGYDRHRAWMMAQRAAPRGLLAIVPRWTHTLLPKREPRARSTRAARMIRDFDPDRYIEMLGVFPERDLRALIAGSGSIIRTQRHQELRTRILQLAAGARLGKRETPDPMRVELEAYLRRDLLVKTDAASMHVGLEVRAPFLSRGLIRACLSASYGSLMPRGERKGLLKQVARRHLPDRIVDRPKQGFAIPIGEWFRSDFGSVRQLLLDHLRSADPFPGLGDAGIEIDMGFVERMIREHDAAGEGSINPWRGRDHAQRLYMLLVLSIWCKWLDRLGREERASGAGR